MDLDLNKGFDKGQMQYKKGWREKLFIYKWFCESNSPPCTRNAQFKFQWRLYILVFLVVSTKLKKITCIKWLLWKNIKTMI